MTSSPSEPAGLRERKKAKTSVAIQEHALRLFREQGYAATTVNQIAAAAEISPSTFFRYFPTKEATVLFDRLDPVLMRAAAAQPAELSPIGALRKTLRQIFDALPRDEWERERERQLLVFNEPELRGAILEQFAGGLAMIAEFAAERTGRSPEDFEVRNWAGAVIGVILAAFYQAGGDPFKNYIHVIDEGFAHLEKGLPL